ncbi:class I SAM-dependent methyltransferase [Propionivibrio sp.]|uniref:class I SAM-dependent methyltransferase n=1 Tax=Propionivibrio sp. TaxID=2212460 RepID=UPI00261DD7BF|nr:class I SAM-dependent methyltransferase [Propionivibrio sp.]
MRNIGECSVCGFSLCKVYESSSDISITSLGALLPGKTVVFLCKACSHLQTSLLFEAGKYYNSNYKINSADIDDDDLYGVENNYPVYRSMHQARVFVEKMAGSGIKNILDYGCGKALTAKQALLLNPELDFYLYDVSRDYEDFWKSYCSSEKYAFFDTPIGWGNFFDCVTSFFSLEHVIYPLDCLLKIRNLLNSGGFLYAVVPNIYSANRSDLLVADHLHHYSPTSMKLALESCAFKLIEVDHNSHQQASVYIAKAVSDAKNTDIDVSEVKPSVIEVEKIVEYWKSVEARLNEFEVRAIKSGVNRIFIFGAGIIGVYFFTKFVKKDLISGFIDSNIHKQKKFYCGLPVFSPDSIDIKSADALLVGMNSGVGKNVINAMRNFDAIKNNTFFVD